MKSGKKQIRWMRVALLFLRLIALLWLADFLQDWADTDASGHETLLHKAIGLACIVLAILFAVLPMLAECGIPIADPLSHHEATSTAHLTGKPLQDRHRVIKGVIWTVGLTLLFLLLLALDQLRYFWEADTVPVLNSIHNIAIGVVGGFGYGGLLLLQRWFDVRVQK